MLIDNSASRVTLFLFGGLASGLLTVWLTHGSDDNGIIPGIVFGVILADCLLLSGAVDSIWQVVLVIIVTFIAYCFSIFSAIGLQMSYPQIVPPGEQWSMGQTEPASPVALLFGGAVGGFILFGGVFLLVAARTGVKGIVSKAFQGAILGGALGVAGWALRSSVGVAIWHLFHFLGLTHPWELSPRDWFGEVHDYSETTRMYSLFVVWQTCIAMAIGLILRKYSRELPRKGVRHQR
jgi:hypothetical protein